MKAVLPLMAVLYAAAVMSVTSCKDDNMSLEESVPLTQEDIEYPSVGSSSLSYFVIGTDAPEYLLKALAGRLPNAVSSADQADVVAVASGSLMSNRDLVTRAFLEGKTVVELEPRARTHCEFWNSIGAGAYLMEDSDDEILFLARNRNACYMYQNPFAKEVFPSLSAAGVDDAATESENEKDISASIARPSVPLGKTADFLDTKLNSFVTWLSENGKSGRQLSEGSFFPTVRELTDYLANADFTQHVTYTLNVGVDNFEICSVLWSDPDRVSRHSTVDLDIYVVPFYAYEENGNAHGDYYFVKMALISHNSPLYGLYKVWHGLVRTWAHAFYSKDLRFTASVIDSPGSGIMTPRSAFSFFQTPVPTTTQSGRTYSSGFSSSLNLSGQAGVNSGMFYGTFTVGGSFTWSDTQSSQVPDLSIEQVTGGTDRSVRYDYLTNNILQEDETSAAVPAIGRTDEKCEASWCWHVDAPCDDDSVSAYQMDIDLKLNYGYEWRHSTWACEGNSSSVDLLSRRICVPLRSPNRTRMGIIDLKSTSSENIYITDICVIDSQGKTVAVCDEAKERESHANFQVPVGEYRLRFVKHDGDTGESYGMFEIPSVSVVTARTANCATLDARRIDEQS